MWSEPQSTRTPAHTQNEEYGPVAIHNNLTGGVSHNFKKTTTISWPRHQEKPSRGPKHGQYERQMRFHKAKEMLRKAKKHGYPTILSRWEGEETYRSSLMTEGFREKDIWNFDQLALEKHDNIATRSERLLRYSQQWVLSKNSDGKQLSRHLCQERAADEFMANSKQSYKTQTNTSKSVSAIRRT